MSQPATVRIDVWLWRARFAKTRAAAARLVAAGGVRLAHGDLPSRRLEKPAAAIAPGDSILFVVAGALRAVRVKALGVRRGPPAEARALYEDLAAPPNQDLAGLA